MRAAAVVGARNEEIYIRSCLRGLIGEGLGVVLIDHGSEDATVRIAREFLGRGLLDIVPMPWRGTFSMQALLRLKEEVIAGLDHDWVLHIDADEWPMTPDAGESLLDFIAAADRDGYNCVNFDEFCFLPLAGDCYREDHKDRMRDYYFFEPQWPRLMRGWKRGTGLSPVASGGHVLRGGDVRRCPESLVLRHYLVLSDDHAVRKYVGRRFAQDELDRGHHHSRTMITATNCRVRGSEAMRRLPEPSARTFDRSAPVARHYWEWPLA
nr:glycosyltransferase family 2 protein [Prosthecomicrobium pneumaticum]